MADDTSKLEGDSKKEKLKVIKKKKFFSKVSGNYGSNKDGSPKISVKKDQKLLLTAAEQRIYKKLKII